MSTSIKDFIIDVDEDLLKSEKKVEKEKVAPSYEVILENNTDFVVRRKTAKTDKDLVVIVSKGLFYIKDNKKENIKKINEINCNRAIKSFFKEYTGGITFEKLSWTPCINVNGICNIITNKSLQNIHKHGINAEYLESHKLEELSDMLDKNSKLVRYFLSEYEGDSKIGYYKFNILREIFKFYEEFGFNNTKYLIDCLKEAEFLHDDYIYISGLIKSMKKYNLNVITFIEYITFGLKRQGVVHIDSGVARLYSDYLDMSYYVYGVVKEKYPKYLRTQHDMIQYKYNLWMKYKKDLLIFENSKEHEELAYSNKDYCIMTPKSAQDLLDEAVNNNSCLASYISKIAKKETLVVFLRRKEDPEETFITIEVKDKKIMQVEGYSNRYYFDNSVKEFIEKWAKEKNLEIVCRLKVKEVC